MRYFGIAHLLSCLDGGSQEEWLGRRGRRSAAPPSLLYRSAGDDRPGRSGL